MRQHITFISKSFIKLVLSRTARNTYLVFIGNILSAFFAFVFTVILVRKLEFAEVGYFSALLSFLLLISDLTDIGIGSTLSTFVPNLQKDKKQLYSFIKTSFILQTVLALFVTTVILIFSAVLSSILFHTITFAYLIRITALGIFCSILVNYFQFLLSSQQLFLKVSFLSALGGILRIILLGIILLAFTLNVDTAVWIQTLMVIILFLVSFYFVGTNFLSGKLSRVELKKILSFAYFLGIARGLTALASRLDVLMLIALTDATQAGIYSTASRVISIYPLLSGSFSTVIAPKLSSIKDKKGLKDFMIKVTLATIGIIATIVCLIIFAQPFLTLLFGPKAEPAVSVFQLLLVSMIFFVGSIPAVSLAIYYLRKPKILSINSVIQLFIVIGGNFFFIPRFGRIGAAYSVIIAFGITLFLTSYLVYRDLQKKHAKQD